MGIMKIPKKWSELLSKYKYVVLVAALGIGLMLWPLDNDADTQAVNQQNQNNNISTQAQLENVLTKIKGVGRVSVMLTTTKGEEIIYKTDSDISADQTREDTVILSDSDRAQSGLITQINSPIYLGAIIVCDGADDPNVCLAVIDAVKKLTGLGANNISVLKMN